VRADVVPGYSNGSSRRVLTLIAALAAAVVAMSGSSDSTPAPAHLTPTFYERVEDQSYTVGEAITPLVLPAATGGNGELSYSLEPAVAGLAFHPATRTLSWTPHAAGTYPLRNTMIAIQSSRGVTCFSAEPLPGPGPVANQTKEC